VRDYHQLEIWQRSMTYAGQIYAFTMQLPPEERFCLVTQLRKAAISVPLNVAERSGCTTDGEFGRFLSYAYRSLKEIVTGLELCERLYPVLPSPPIADLIEEGNQISRMTHGFMRRLGVETLNSQSSILRAQGSKLKAERS
jgi:four helix bundle protein